jgi:ribonuclease J
MSLVQVIPLGGVGEIGKNCTVVRQGDDIVVIDCGLSFPDEEMFGVDIVIPDFTYLIENKEKIRGIFLTHAHEDHVGSLPMLLAEITVPIYCTDFTAALIRTKLEEKLDKSKIQIRIFKHGDTITAGGLSVEPIRITHSIPENCGMAVHTQFGVIFFTGDFKFDFTPVDGKHTNMTRLAELGQEGVLCLLSDSTNVDRPGWGPSESTVTEGLRAVFNESEGRVLLTTFASNIHRMQQVFDVAAETGRKVVVVGRRMEQNLEICERLGYVKLPKNIKVPLEDIGLFEVHQLAILTTGSQGEPLSALVQMSKGSYGRMQIRNGDTLIYSARPIPGNEAAIWRTINRLFDLGCRVVYEHSLPVHVSGHAYQEELKMMINLTKPFYVAPVHGEARHQFAYNRIAVNMGVPDHRVFTMKGGVPLEFTETSASLGEAVPYGEVLLDNSGRAGVTTTVLKDRSIIANEGVVFISIVHDAKKGATVGAPMLSTRGFSGDEKALSAVKESVWDAMTSMSKEEGRDPSRVQAIAADTAKRMLSKRTGMRPLVVIQIVELS